MNLQKTWLKVKKIVKKKNKKVLTDFQKQCIITLSNEREESNNDKNRDDEQCD